MGKLNVVQRMITCVACGTPTMHVRKNPNHIRHLLLTLITLGLWGIIWIIVAMNAGRFICTNCGHVAHVYQK